MFQAPEEGHKWGPLGSTDSEQRDLPISPYSKANNCEEVADRPSQPR